MGRQIGFALAAGLLLAPGAAPAKEPLNVTDLAGREVTVQVPVEHMILGEGRFLPSLAILDREDPTTRVVGMMGDFRQLDPATWAQYAKRFPNIEDIPTIGRAGADSFSSERAITVQSDVAVFGLLSGHSPGATHTQILDSLAAAGIPVVIIDFRIDPLVNTPKSIEMLGRLMGREREAAEFLDFYREQLDIIARQLAGVERRPTVFMESRVGLGDDCCEAIGDAMMGRFIAWAGGTNMLAERIPGTHGTVSTEFLIVNQPEVYMGTAVGNHAPDRPDDGRIVLGAGAPEAAARQSLRQTTQRTGINLLDAVHEGRAHAIWHHFYNTPMHVAAVQAMAKWLHPALFTDIDPRATLQTYFDRFQPVPLDGTYWVSLPAD